jgi:hypothetical protein
MATVTDPNGVDWWVDRVPGWWDFGPADQRGGTGEDAEERVPVARIALIGMLLPWAYIAHLLGLPWTIVIHRDGMQVGREKVRGWNKSKRRIQEIADSAAAGTLEQSLGLPPATGPGGG